MIKLIQMKILLGKTFSKSGVKNRDIKANLGHAKKKKG